MLTAVSNPATTAIDTSIVLATCSRAPMLRVALESLLTQASGPSRPIEIIVVDDRSTDETPALLAGFQQRSPIPFTILQGPGLGVAAARNCGSNHATGTWIASFDDDQIALPNWLQKLRELADSTGAACVGGALELQLPPGISVHSIGPRTRRVLGEHLISNTPVSYTHNAHPATNNALIRRSVFTQVNGYDTTFTEGGEDKDFFERISAAGHTLWFQPSARALHITPATRLQRNNLRWTSLRLGASDARLLQRKRPFFGPLKLAILRLLVAQLRDLPQWLFAKVRGASSTDILCSLWYTQGLLRALPSMLFPTLISSRFIYSLDFRNRNGERKS